MLTRIEVAHLFEAAVTRLNLGRHKPDEGTVRRAEERLEGARQRMMNPAAQRAARDAYKQQGVQTTSVMRTPINVKALEDLQIGPGG